MGPSTEPKGKLKKLLGVASGSSSSQPPHSELVVPVPALSLGGFVTPWESFTLRGRTGTVLVGVSWSWQQSGHSCVCDGPFSFVTHDL